VLAEVDEAKMEMDIIDEQVETVGRAFLALTLGCARCHDHKFDPISTRDYYGLAGIFKSTKAMESFTKIARWHEVNVETDRERAIRLESESRIAALQQQIDELERSVTASVTTSAGPRSGQANESADDACRADQQENSQARLALLRAQLEGLKQSCPEPATAMSVVDYDQPTDLRVHVRGSHLTQADQVPRGIPAVFLTDDRPAVELSEQHSGRLELANWLVDPRHPLVARVMVNRVWRWHFGRGLVESTDNFGRLGTRPNNPALLDWLAQRFVADGWSLKSLHRRIMHSATYRLSSRFDPSNAQIDPDNHWQWRTSVRRLEAEAIRDAILAVGGQLDRSFGGSSLHVKNREFLFDHTSRDHTNYVSRRRSLYLPVIRNHLYDGFQLFDYTDASVMTSNRANTVVAPQALFLMNGDMAVEGARALADRLLDDAELTDQERIARVFQLGYGRMPTEAECDAASRFLAEFKRRAEGDDVDSVARLSWSALCQAVLMSSEFIYLR
jgi:hypothetical protein